ncbi:protein translocase subunit SecD [Candidatus Microgenomates bacterium]|nr:protein translocase subunit SecD [Candidatus Microgenomates bacterium]
MSHRFLVWLIVLVTAAAVLVDLPKTLPRLNFKIGNIKVDYQFERPALDFNFLGSRIQRDLDIKEGLDLAGGTALTLQADMSAVAPADRDTALDSLKGIIERRVNLFGVSEPVIQTSKTGGQYRVNVELAGVTDVNSAVDLVGKTAELTFRESTTAGEVSTTSAFGPFSILTNLSGKDLKLAKPSFKQDTSEPIIQLTFNSEGTQKFADITKRNLNKQLAIFLDNQLLMAPTIQAIITDGQPIISGGFTAEQTKQFAILLNSGALPAPVHVLDQHTIGATLGQDSINKSLFAGIVGLVIVALFMVANYGRLGLFADLALAVYSLLVLAIFKLIPVTLTLAGIAGFILSIGMAVDANILIFERMKEEIRWGRNKLAAVELGFSRAFPSIRDSNASSLITCAILFYFGTGPVKGFALTLAIGIAVSLFTAITVTRTLLRLTKHG